MAGIIVGGGIVGLTTALTLHRAGIAVQIFEEAQKIKELGVGFNLLPHSVKHLVDLGLKAKLDANGVQTAELKFYCKQGRSIWQEPRGLAAGYPVPQYSIHRGRLQAILKEEVIKRLGIKALTTDQRLIHFDQDESAVSATFESTAGDCHEQQGDFLIGADGINSATRAQLYPNQGEPHFAGLMLWRGATEADSFLTGRTMIMAGHNNQKVVIYPISNPNESGKQLINWVAELRVPPDTLHQDNWNNAADRSEFAAEFAGWKFDWLDIPQLFQQTGQIFKFPMVDRDPVDHWSFGRVTLAGDAAHAMYPNGSNGASQGILDAISLEKHLSANPDNIQRALLDYEAERLPATRQLTLDNRQTGPERVLQMVEERCAGACTDKHTCVPEHELQAVAQAYKKLAGFDKATVAIS